MCSLQNLLMSVNEEVQEFLAQHLIELGVKKGMSILDFDCGNGIIHYQLQKLYVQKEKL